MVIVIGVNFVSTCRTTAPRTMAAATAEAVKLIPTTRTRLDNMTKLVWSNKNKNKHKHKHKHKHKYKINNLVATSPPLRLQTATPVLLLLLPLRKQGQQRRHHRGSGGSSSSRAVAAAAHYFKLPCPPALPCSASGIKSPSFFLDTTIPI